MKDINILSIDFDFFQKTSAETMKTFYPDGIDLSPKLTELVWKSKYENARMCGEDLGVLVSLDREKLEELKRNLHASFSKNNSPYLMIRNSHVHAYDFVKTVLEKEQADGSHGVKIHIVNVDMHHDFFNKNENLDCGNWLGKTEEYLSTQEFSHHIRWITQPVAFEVYGLNDVSFFSEAVKFDFAELENVVWDAIFLCRSDAWLPPHLDSEFCDFANSLIEGVTYTGQIEESAMQVRMYLETKV